MKQESDFRQQLRKHLSANGSRILLRIVTGPSFDEPVELTGKEILDRSEALVEECVPDRNGGVVLLLLPHSPELFLLHLGLILKGCTPGILAWPTSRIDLEKYQRNLVYQLGNLPARALITLPRLAENLSAALPYVTSACVAANAATHEKLFPTGPVTDTLEQCRNTGKETQAPADSLFLQFTGGTTGAQKAIVVTASMLAAQMQSLTPRLGFTRADSVVSWLPMYHDMGLIACLWLPLWHGGQSVHIGANDWVLDPELLLKNISRYGASFCWLPNFAFSYLSQRRHAMKGSWRLDSMRAWINCSEPCRLSSMRSFAEAFADCGVCGESLQASYAMAETVFAITQTELDRPVATVPRSRVQYGTRVSDEVYFDLIDDVFVSSGKPLDDTEVAIIGGAGQHCADEQPGEIYVRTPSLFGGYWGAEGFKTHSLNDGWHATGDYGFRSGDDLFVIGRLKDIVIIGGQNVFPEDVELVINSIEGIHPGRVVAFGIEDLEYGTEALAVVAEQKGDYDPRKSAALEPEIRRLVVASIGIAPRYVSVVPERWIVKSTAGKISRRETRDRFMREAFPIAQSEVA